MKGLFAVLLMFIFDLPSLCARIMLDRVVSPFNVVTYGATGDGLTDDSPAFVKAWEDTCGAIEGTPTLLIPKGKTFMLQPVSFQGPCKSATVNVQLEGTIIAPKNVEAWEWAQNDRSAWVQFEGITGLVINGQGLVDGQGAAWWNDYNSHNDYDRPTALRFGNCENLRLSSLTHINSPRNHISIDTCNGAYISNLYISAPEDSPNTDGFDIASSTNIVIENSVVETGDDCIAINSGSSFINVTGLYCGPGHGISVGSLGKNGAYNTVDEVYVRNCTFNGTTNGARIKTWKGGSGYARKITFEDIILVSAKNPVIIDQNYDPNDVTEAAVKVSDVTYRNMRGTSSCEEVIQLNCDNTVSCTNIVLDNINITSAIGEKIYASCNNAHGTSFLCNPHVSCLSL
ncbi:probable polygalacturonase At3g15720 [Gastrolobium bilobum]|uniref:probable polygalacturonase At3g15720 n=1 Tax=Gastrolobium bilobum TaxID=150636 RepID=UPI002AAFDBFC|nr:probable polygalacturonase At3g15720 [Gastrolobium bilobum]